MTSFELPAHLVSGLELLGFKNDLDLAERLTIFGRLLLSENERTNLVGAHTLEDLVSVHFLDSLAPLKFLELNSPVIDAGSGAGLPGIPIAIAKPTLEITLLEPRVKRAEFLRLAARMLDLPNVKIQQLTAHSCKRAGLTGTAQTVVMRAVARPPVAVALGLPLLRVGGRLVLYQGRAKKPPEAVIKSARVHSGNFVQAHRVDVPYLVAERHVWIFRKEASTGSI